MSYREECLVRLEAARARMDDAFLNAPDNAALHDAWHTVFRELMNEQPPEHDQLWLLDRVQDLEVHVFSSPRWQQSLDSLEPQKRPIDDG